jgi:ubiquinone/menaquinone biosynthesis C-methylase UbiE
MNLLLLTIALARLAGVWVRESGFRGVSVVLDLGNLHPTTQPEWLILLGLGVGLLLLVALMVFAGIRLGKWFMGRTPKPTGATSPLDEPELYDLRTADLKEDLDFWKQIAREISGPVLELGTRTGRVALELAKTGLLVTGLEPSRAMLQRARVKAEELSPKTRLEWVEAELYNFSLGGRKFRLILLPMPALQELSDLHQIEQCLHCAAAHLEPDGRVVLEVQAPRLEALKAERHLVKAFYSPRTSQVVNYYHSQEADPLWHKLKGTHEYEIWESSKPRKVSIPTQGHYFDCPEVLLLLRDAGLEVETIYGSYAREPLSQKSQHLIFLARPLRVPTLPASAPTPALAARPSGKQAMALPAPANPAAAGETSPTWPAIPVAVPVGSSASASSQKAGAEATATPALPPPAPSSSAGEKAAQPAPAQGLQPPAVPPSGGRSTSQRRKTSNR